MTCADVDDAPALQKAIDAATEQGRALLLPAGHYRINSTLTILSSARTHFANPGPGYACPDPSPVYIGAHHIGA